MKSISWLLVALILMVCVGWVGATTVQLFPNSSGGVDGTLIYTPNGSFNKIFNQASATSGTSTQTDATTVLQASALTNEFNSTQTTYIGFGTSSLPRNVSIQSATVFIRAGVNPVTLGSIGYALTKVNLNQVNNLNLIDWNRSNFSSTPLTAYAIPTQVVYNPLVLNSAGLAYLQDAVTRGNNVNFSWRSYWDINGFFNSTWVARGQNINGWSTDESNTNRPYMNVTYGATSQSGFGVLPPMGLSGTNFTFTDNSTFAGGWNWSFTGDNGTKILFSQVQNPVKVFDTGNYIIEDNVTNLYDGVTGYSSSFTNISVLTTSKYIIGGDSIVRGTVAGSDLSPNGTDNFGNQMVAKYDAGATITHNVDGGGQTSAWGRTNMGTHYRAGSTYFVWNYGANDPGAGITGTQSGQNAEWAYNYIINNGTTPIIFIRVLGVNGSIWEDVNNISQEETYLTAHSIPFKKGYDATDSNPWSNTEGIFNLTNYVTGLGSEVHPNKAGHGLLGDYLWCSINNNCAFTTIAPVASFTTNWTGSGTSVQFNDTSTGSPTTWKWGYNNKTGNNTWLNGPTTQNPIISFPIGNWSINLTANNTAGSNTSTQITFVNLTSSNFPVTPTPTPTPTPNTTTTITRTGNNGYCENSTGNIRLWLTQSTETSLSLEWNWTNITRLSVDGRYISDVDNSSLGFIQESLLPGSWHKIRIYSGSDYGSANCTTNLTPWSPDINPPVATKEKGIDIFTLLGGVVAMFALFSVISRR